MSTLRLQRQLVYLSLGSNIAPQNNLPRAIELLQEHSKAVAISSVYQTAPQVYTQQDDFWNVAMAIKTPFPPDDLKHDVIAKIEHKLFRRRDPNNPSGPRTIDIDISLWENRIFKYGDKPWQIPDPDILQYAYVAVPLAEIAPDYQHPEQGKTLAEIASQFDQSDLKKLTDVTFDDLISKQ